MKNVDIIKTLDQLKEALADTSGRRVDSVLKTIIKRDAQMDERWEAQCGITAVMTGDTIEETQAKVRTTLENDERNGIATVTSAHTLTSLREKALREEAEREEWWGVTKAEFKADAEKARRDQALNVDSLMPVLNKLTRRAYKAEQRLKHHADTLDSITNTVMEQQQRIHRLEQQDTAKALSLHNQAKEQDTMGETILEQQVRIQALEANQSKILLSMAQHGWIYNKDAETKHD